MRVALVFIGTSAAPTLSEVPALVAALQWIVLGVALWRHSPSAGRRNAGIAVANS
jgi:hypothetical protein